jgi:hypothetical protein
MMDDQGFSYYARNDEENRNRGSRSNPVLLLIVACAGCLFVLICGGIIGLVIWGKNAVDKDMPPVQAAASNFFDSIRAGDLNAAYEKTSSSFRTQNTPERFADFIKQYEILTKHDKRTLNAFIVFNGTTGKHARIQMTLQAPNNAMTCTLILVEENGAWKINQVTIP